MGICTLYFVRHGESEANAGIANQPDHEIILTATGQSQARQLVERLDVQPAAVATTTVGSEEIFNKPGIGVLPTLAITILAFLLLTIIVAATTNKKTVEGEESTESMLKSLIFSPF